MTGRSLQTRIAGAASVVVICLYCVWREDIEFHFLRTLILKGDVRLLSFALQRFDKRFVARQGFLEASLAAANSAESDKQKISVINNLTACVGTSEDCSENSVCDTAWRKIFEFASAPHSLTVREAAIGELRKMEARKLLKHLIAVSELAAQNDVCVDVIDLMSRLTKGMCSPTFKNGVATYHKPQLQEYLKIALGSLENPSK